VENARNKIDILKNMPKKVLLIICDGLGLSKKKKHNAISMAKTPNLDRLWKENPHAILDASGEAIGLPKGQMGTSEANHLVIGSGRIIYQNLEKINNAIKNGDLEKNEAILEAIDHVKKYQSILHIKGLASPGGVHSHVDHIKALILIAKKHGVKDIMLHLFTDGRDTPPKSALKYIEDLEKFISKNKIGKIASIGGRFFGMDRDNNLDRTEKHFEILLGKNRVVHKNAKKAILDAYKKGLTDEFIEPRLIEIGKGEIGCIQSNDAVIFSNFRSDRARQITKRFIDSKIDNLKYVAMTKYDDDFDIRVAFPPEEISNTLSEVIAKNSLKQLKVTETEKFAHLTFYFNAQRYKEEKGEKRILIESNKDIPTHDFKPEMKAKEITDKIIKEMGKNKFDFIATNIVNCDMVGHSGNLEATIKGVESVDEALGKLVFAAKKNNYTCIITADHGNAEETFDEKTRQPLTSHTTNPVPFIINSKKIKELKKTKGSLADIAPTILKIMRLKIPKEMTGKSLI